jgi:hypothetical protein
MLAGRVGAFRLTVGSAVAPGQQIQALQHDGPTREFGDRVRGSVMVAPQGFLVKFGISSWHLISVEMRAEYLAHRQTDRRSASEWSTSGRQRRSSRAPACQWANAPCTPVVCAFAPASHSHLLSPAAERARFPSCRRHSGALATAVEKASEAQLTPVLALRT